MLNNNCDKITPCGQCATSLCSKTDINTLSKIRNDIILVRKNLPVLFEALLGLSNCNNVSEIVESQIKILQNAIFNLSCYIDNFNIDCFRCSCCENYFILNKTLAILGDLKQNYCSLQANGLSKKATSCSIVLMGEGMEIYLILATQYITQIIQDHVCYIVD